MPHPVTAPRRGRPLLVSIALMSLLALGGVVTAFASAPAPAAIDGVRFTDAELALASVRAERGGADADDTSARWDALRDDLALFAVARSVGASDVTRPGDILDVVDEVNARRAGTASSGGVVYGPVTYDPASFYGKSLTDIRQAALKRIESGATDLHVTDSEVRARFDADRASWADAATTYHLTRVAVASAADGGPDKDIVAAAQRGDVERVLSGSPQEQVSITSDQVAANALGPDATAALLSATDGSLLGPFAERGSWVAYRVDGRSVDAEAAFTHYAARIRSVIYAERLDALVADARDAQIVVGP